MTVVVCLESHNSSDFESCLLFEAFTLLNQPKLISKYRPGALLTYAVDKIKYGRVDVKKDLQERL